MSQNTKQKWPEYKLNKWAMIACKGGRCQGPCGKLATFETTEQFHFHHRVKLNDGNDNTDRWGGRARFMRPFTDEWIAWALKVDLLCEPCHRGEHRSGGQLSIDWEAQARIDGVDKSIPVYQLELV